jgi:hypothetical protein
MNVVAWKEALAKITSKEGPRENQQLRGLSVVAWKEALAKITSKEGPRENHLERRPSRKSDNLIVPRRLQERQG